MYFLQNNKLKIAVKKTGAELCRITSVKNKTDFMWDANPKVWSGYAPNLFPIVGALKNNTFIYSDKHFKLPKHGFVRDNNNVELHEQTSNSLVFKLTYSAETLKMYPFKFEFYVNYTLLDNKVDVKYTIKNIDDKSMFFSVGGHPSFKCPVFEKEDYKDYILEFEADENSKTHLVNTETGLINLNQKSVFNNSNHIQLSHNLFNDDALIFKDLKSKKVSLISKNYGRILSVSYNDFPVLGIWAKTAGDYVCIEPWLGFPDVENTNQDIKTKEGILKLESRDTYEASYSIEIQDTHLD